VRSLAVVAAAGLDDPDGTPAGFWEAAALTATGAELVAGLVGADLGDAFCVGLLHVIGAALLHQHQPLPEICLPELDDPQRLLVAERDRYGIAHDEIGARVLAAWQFPEHVCTLISRHHEPILPDAEPLERSLHAARLLADLLITGAPPSPVSIAVLAQLTEGRLGEGDLPATLDRMRERSAALRDGLLPRR